MGTSCGVNFSAIEIASNSPWLLSVDSAPIFFGSIVTLMRIGYVILFGHSLFSSISNLHSANVPKEIIILDTSLSFSAPLSGAMQGVEVNSGFSVKN